MAFSSLSDLVSYFENPSGIPTLLNSKYDATHTASGLYQVTNTTWNNFGGYPTAASAPVDVQQAQFAQMVGARGLADYTCPNCDPALTNYVAANPGVLSLPIGTGATGTSGTPGTVPTTPGAAPATVTSPTTATTAGNTSWIWSAVVNGSVILLGVGMLFLGIGSGVFENSPLATVAKRVRG